MSAKLLTVGELLAHLQAGKQAREFDSTPGVSTLLNLSLSWFGTNLTAGTFKRLRFEGALRLGKYVDGEDDESIDTVSVTDLAVALRAVKDRFRDPSKLPIEAIENADAVVRGDTTEADSGQEEGEQAEGTGAESDRWLTVSDAARIAACNKGLISRAVESGSLKSNGKAGRERRIDAVALTQWLRVRAMKPEPAESDAAVEGLVKKHVRD